MAAGKKDNKRKAVPPAAAPKETQPSKKVKKADQKSKVVETESSKPSATKGAKKNATTTAPKSEPAKSVPVKVDDQPARKMKPRKRAADYLSDDDEEDKTKATSSAPAEEPSKKKSKAQNGAAVPAPKTAEKKTTAKAAESAKVKNDKQKKKAKSPSPVVSEDEDEDEEISFEEAESEASDSEESEDDDQTAALIEGFESSDDEMSGEESFKPGQKIPDIPDSKQVKRKLKNKKKEHAHEKEEPGVVYVGRIPHGFYEHEMRAYFSQFGEIKRLRLSRNRKTGQSKHFAFIEFASTSVAKVVADTMDNYLMFGHILKCKFVPTEQVHPQLWKGANRRFKKTPWNDIEKRRLEKSKSSDQWTKKIQAEEKRRARQAEKLKAIGYDFKMPELKRPEEALKAIADKPADEPEAIEAAPEKAEKTTAEEKPAKKEKKKGKQAATSKEAAAQPAPASEPEKKEEAKPVEEKPKKANQPKSKKNKKTKA